MKLTTHLHLVPKLGIVGAMPPLNSYAFMTWGLMKTGTILLTSEFMFRMTLRMNSDYFLKQH
jgi:hypothetical protein